MSLKLLLDSADPAALRELLSLGVFSGVTTTPTFFARLGVKDVQGAIGEICELCSGEVHVEAMGSCADEILENAQTVRRLSPRIVVKVPMGAECVKAVARLRKVGIPTNVHLIYSVNQAILAAEAGAAYLCLLVGRMDDTGANGSDLARNVVRLSKGYSYSAQTMGSSIRGPADVRSAMECGVDAITIPPGVVRKMLCHPLTDLGVGAFLRDSRLAAPVRTVMRGLSDVPTVTVRQPLMDALNLMTEKAIGISVVIDTQGMLLGVTTDGDIRRALSKRGPKVLQEPMECIANRSPVCIEDGASAAEVREKMERERISVVVVLDRDGRPLGLVDIHDL